MKKYPALRFALVLLPALATWPLAAEVVEITLPPETASFKAGIGSDAANGQCLTCHSVDYVATQPPMPETFWAAEVKKMQTVYGAQIPEDQVPLIEHYLAYTYGTGTNPPPPAVVKAAFGNSASAAPGAPLEGPAVAAKYGCLGCHNVSVKIVGPAYKDIAAKYAKDPEAYARISEQIHKGGSGKWGSVIMPPFATVSDAEVKALASWILSCK